MIEMGDVDDGEGVDPTVCLWSHRTSYRHHHHSIIIHIILLNFASGPVDCNKRLSEREKPGYIVQCRTTTETIKIHI